MAQITIQKKTLIDQQNLIPEDGLFIIAFVEKGTQDTNVSQSFLYESLTTEQKDSYDSFKTLVETLINSQQPQGN